MELLLIWADQDVDFKSINGIHDDDVTMTTLASQITSLTVVYSIAYTGVDQRKHQSSASLAFVRPGEFPAQRASNAENVSIWWRHHVTGSCCIDVENNRTLHKTQMLLNSWPWIIIHVFVLFGDQRTCH